MNTEVAARSMDFITPEQQDNSSSLLFAWRRKWILVILAGIGVALGYLYFLNQKPTYESMAQVLVIDQQPIQVQGMELAESYDNTHEVLIQSQAVAALAATELESKQNTRKYHWSEIMAGLSVTRASRDRASGDVYDVRFRSPSQSECEDVLRAVVNAYEQFLGATYKDANHDAAVLIDQAKNDVELQISSVEEDYARFKATIGRDLHYVGQDILDLHGPRMTQFDSERSKVELENSRLQAQIMTIEKALQRGDSEEMLNLLVKQLQPRMLLDEDRIQLESNSPLAQRLLQLGIDEKRMQLRYGKDHPEVIAIQNEIEIIKKHEAELNELTPKTVEPSPRKFLATYLASLREMVKLNDAAIADLNKLFQQERDAANHLSAAQLRDNSFRSEIERKRKLYDTIVKRLDEINMAKEATTMRLERVFQPQPGAQVSPDFALSLGLGGILGALVGLGLAYAVDRADRRFRSPDEIRTDLGLPVVGQIPVIPQEQERPAAEGDVAVPSVVLRTHFHPRGRISEAYRAVRTALYFSTRGSGHQIIQITSPSPGDGKTTLACNLAVTIAQSGKRVLLVDADFRRPRVHRVFNATNDIGVTSVLDGQTDVANVTQTTCVENLWLLPCGVRPENPSELLTSGKFEELLGLLREQYDFVIVDTPPVLAVTDPLNVVTRADGVILVMRLTKSARAASHRALETLEELGANMLGVVVNGVGGTSGYGDYGKYGGYGSYGGYGYGGYGSYGYGYGGYDYRYGYGEGDKSYYEDADDVKSNGHARLGSSRPNGQP